MAGIQNANVTTNVTDRTKDIWSVIAKGLDACSLARLSEVCKTTKTASFQRKEEIKKAFNILEYYCQIQIIDYGNPTSTSGDKVLVMLIKKIGPAYGDRPSNFKHCKNYWVVFLSGFNNHPVNEAAGTQQISKMFVVDAKKDDKLQSYESYYDTPNNTIWMNKLLLYFMLKGIHSLVSYLASLSKMYKENIILENWDVEHPVDDQNHNTIKDFKSHLDKILKEINIDPSLFL